MIHLLAATFQMAETKRTYFISSLKGTRCTQRLRKFFQEINFKAFNNCRNAEITGMVVNSFLSIALMFVDFESGWYEIKFFYLFICFISTIFCISIVYLKESIKLIHTSCRIRSKQTNFLALYSLEVMWINLLTHTQKNENLCQTECM